MNPDYSGDIFSKTSVVAIATQYNVPEGIHNWYRRESIPDVSVLRT
jgi:hypothetical protein